MPSVDDVRDRGGETSLGDLILGILNFFRQFGLLLIPLALLLALMAAVLVSFRPAYKVTALLDAPTMTLEEWRRLQPMLLDRKLVIASLASDKLPDEVREVLQRQFLRPNYWESRVSYRSAVERDDIRQQVNIDPKTVGALGLAVSLTARDDEAAMLQLEAIAWHVRQAMLWSGLRDYLDSLRQQTLERRPELQLAQIRQQFSIQQNMQQTEDMQKLLEEYPELRRNEINTVVSVGDGGGKYLPPLAQIVALQASITESRASLRQVQRELEQLDWRQRFLDRVDAQAPEIHSGVALDALLQAQWRELFADAATDSVKQQVAREIELNLAKERWRVQQIRYKAMPALPTVPVPTRRPLLVAVVIFGGALLAMSLALAGYVAMRRLGKPQEQWSAQHDPLFAWLPERIRHRLLPTAPALGPVERR